MTHASLRHVLIAAGAILAAASGSAFSAGEAEIISLVGQGERRDAESAPWIRAAVKHQIQRGGFVRTLANSQMGLLLADRMQLRINQNSQLQIKSAADASEFKGTTIRLNAGRAWSQARPQTIPGGPLMQPAPVTMETPSATMSIRGTEWEVEVLPDGSTQVAVVTGIVEITNDHGTLMVGPGEAGMAASGKAPVRLQLVNPKTRVQWVSSWMPQPRRWAGPAAAAHEQAIVLIESGKLDAAAALLVAKAAADPTAATLVADIRVSQGDIEDSIGLLRPHSGDPFALALLARALARADKVAEGRQLVESAAAALREHPEVQLAAGELAILDGDVDAARQAFRRMLELQPKRAEGWYGIGLIESERENIKLAREALDRSIAADPGYSPAQAERAAVETFAGNLTESHRILDGLLARQPDNYLVQTALGINLLKGGKPTEALEAFLKAGIIEPRYARAWLFSGVAFYQLGERSRAIEAFRKAAELDSRDPLPHLLESLVIADTLDFGAAIVAAQRAQELMPYLKSLNQIASDQKGSANLGSALASFGMEEWAAWYAREAYSPFWAGSHLFLADRFTGQFTKNSELFKGFVTDPLTLGAPNRFSSLVTAPGHYRKLEALVESNQFRQRSLIATANGMIVDPVPIAYFVSGDLSKARSRDDPSAGNGTSFNLGLGARPSHDLGVFSFLNNTQFDMDLRQPVLSSGHLTLHDSRADLGINMRLAAQNQIWFRAGASSRATDISSAFTSQSTADNLNRLFVTTIFTRNGTLDRYHIGNDQSDLQFRHSIGSDGYTLNWGVEQGRQKRPSEQTVLFTPVRLSLSNEQTTRSTDAYVSARVDKIGAFSVQGDLWAQWLHVDRSDRANLEIIFFVPPLPIALLSERRNQRESELNPRLGITWRILPSSTLRLVGQRWRRPATISTLGPIDTEGVVVNDQLPMEGGLYQRGRLQFEHEAPGRYFIQAFVDRERVNNGVGGARSIVPNLDETALGSLLVSLRGTVEDLRSKRDVFTAVADIEATPRFAEGNVSTYGFAGNVLLDRRHSVSLRYLHRDNRQTGVNSGLRIPFVPRDYLRAASQWTLPDRWLLGVSATYRNLRFRDDLNLQPIKAGWAFGLTAYWESADKRHSLQGILDNLLSDKAAGLENHSRATVRYAYRF